MKNNQITVRTGCKDMWNAFLVDGAEFTLGSDMPICPCTVSEVPKQLISYVEAKRLHKQMIRSNPEYHINAFVHFYIDDQKFDGPRSGVWDKPFELLKLLRHYDGAITVDFSTNSDFPDPIKRFNTYRMRALGRWLSTKGIPIINNVRWGDEETWNYCFDGIPYNSMVCIGTVASGIRLLENRPLFEDGLYKMVDSIRPHTILVYGSSNYECFRTIEKMGIRIITFPSETSLAFKSRRGGK